MTLLICLLLVFTSQQAVANGNTSMSQAATAWPGMAGPGVPMAKCRVNSPLKHSMSLKNELQDSTLATLATLTPGYRVGGSGSDEESRCPGRFRNKRGFPFK